METGVCKSLYLFKDEDQELRAEAVEGGIERRSWPGWSGHTSRSAEGTREASSCWRIGVGKGNGGC